MINDSKTLATDHHIFLAIGSNIVPRKNYISQALIAIQKSFPNCHTRSSLYLTDPYFKLKQPSYYNCSVGFSSGISPRKLLEYCASLEDKLGRVRIGGKWQSRSIDIDILLYGNLQINEPDLVIPHYDLENRDFFLIPLLEIDPDLQHPSSGIELSELQTRIPENQKTYPQKLFKSELLCHN